MKDLNLLLKFKPSGDQTEFQVRSAARISIDGSGVLILHPADDSPAERISLPVHLLSIQSIGGPVHMVM